MGSSCTKGLKGGRESKVFGQNNTDNTHHNSSNKESSEAFSEGRLENNPFKIKPTNIAIDSMSKIQTISSIHIKNLKSLGGNEPHYFNLSKNLEFIKGECVGKGKIASVYSGLSKESGEIVAIKSVKFNKSQPLQKHIFEINEAVEKLSQLKHPNVIKYICTQPSENPDEIDIIFEFCNGGSIKQILDRFGAFDEKLIRLYVKQILEGLVYLHGKNIVHRNIKNCNILIDSNGIAKLSDFIVSNILIGDDPEAILYFNTNNGHDAPFWMAPEIVNKENNLTWAVDIWSIGCIIIEMATKIPPWANITTDCNEVLSLIATSNAPPKFPGHVSRNLKSFLNCCLQKDPTKRLSAKKLLEHEFFKNTLRNSLKRKSQNEPNNKQLIDFRRNVGDVSNKKNSQSFDENLENYKSEQGINSITNHLQNDNFISKRPFKLIQNKKFNIIQNKEKVDDNIQSTENQKECLNMLGTNEEFSISMTVGSEHSMLPHGQEIFIGNRILPADITEVEEIDSPIVVNKRGQNFFELNKINIQENTNDHIDSQNGQNIININRDNNINNFDNDQSYSSLKYLIENDKFNDIKTDDLDKLATMKLSKEEIRKLDLFFKQGNNIVSISPIEQERIQQHIKLMK